MACSRRDFLTRSALGVVGAVGAGAAACKGRTPGVPAQPGGPTALPPGTPPAFGTAAPVGPEVAASTIAEAEKLVQVQYSAPERAQAAGNWPRAMAPIYERRTGPRKVALEPAVAPAAVWNPMLADLGPGPAKDCFIRSAPPATPLPPGDADIAFAPVTLLSRWIQSRAITSERLTRIYLERLERFDPRLRCVITMTRDLALAQAR